MTKPRQLSDSVNPNTIPGENLKDGTVSVDKLSESLPASDVDFVRDSNTRTVQNKLEEYVSVTDFGAVGDGVHDDTAAIQAAIDSGARTIFFPDPETYYRITDTLRVGVWVVNRFVENGILYSNPLGAAFAKANIRFVGESKSSKGPVIFWDGPDQPGDNAITLKYKDTNTGVVTDYPYITNDKPMLHLFSSTNIEIERLSLNGGVDGKRAFAGIHTEGFITVRHAYKGMVIENCRIGVRTGLQWNWGGAPGVGGVYQGYGGSPFGAAIPQAVGGWQGDSCVYERCDLDGDIAGFSCESAQNLGLQFISCLFGGGQAGVLNIGGWLSFNGCSWGGISSVADIWNIANNSYISLRECHTESLQGGNAGGWAVRTTTTASSSYIVAENGDMVTFRLSSGSGNVSMRSNRSLTRILRANNLAPLKLTIENSRIESIDLGNFAGNPEDVRIALTNCDLDNPVPTGTTPYILRAINTYPKANLPAGSDLGG